MKHFSNLILAIAITSAVVTQASAAQGTWMRISDPTKILCTSDGLWSDLSAVALKNGVLSDPILIFGPVMDSKRKFRRACARAKVSGIEYHKAVYLNNLTGEMVPEDGYFIHPK
jgi:hypothetical protein